MSSKGLHRNTVCTKEGGDHPVISSRETLIILHMTSIRSEVMCATGAFLKLDVVRLCTLSDDPQRIPSFQEEWVVKLRGCLTLSREYPMMCNCGAVAHRVIDRLRCSVTPVRPNEPPEAKVSQPQSTLTEGFNLL